MTFVRGLLLAFAFEMAAQALWPDAVGAHVALASYAAAFAAGGRTVYWRYAAVILLAWAIGVPRLVGWSPGLALHFVAGLVAAAVALGAPFPIRDARDSFAATLAPTRTIG